MKKLKVNAGASENRATWDAVVKNASEASGIAEIEVENEKLRAALEAAANELKGIANIAVTVTSGKAANAINTVRIIRATAIDAMCACWTALGKEW